MLCCTAIVACDTEEPAERRAPDAVLGAIQVFDLGAPAPAAPEVGALYFTLVNTGSAPDTLTAVATPDGTAMLHTVVTEGGVSRMRHLTALPIAPGDTVRLRPGSYHVMVERRTRPWAVGTSIPFTLTFARAGALDVAAPVMTYTEVVERLEGAEGR